MPWRATNCPNRRGFVHVKNKRLTPGSCSGRILKSLGFRNGEGKPMFPTVYGKRERRGYQRAMFWEFVVDKWDEIFCVLVFFGGLLAIGLIQ
jgi:hypothetical protein